MSSIEENPHTQSEAESTHETPGQTEASDPSDNPPAEASDASQSESAQETQPSTETPTQTLEVADPAVESTDSAAGQESSQEAVAPDSVPAQPTESSPAHINNQAEPAAAAAPSESSSEDEDVIEVDTAHATHPGSVGGSAAAAGASEQKTAAQLLAEDLQNEYVRQLFQQSANFAGYNMQHPQSMSMFGGEEEDGEEDEDYLGGALQRVPAAHDEEEEEEEFESDHPISKSLPAAEMGFTAWCKSKLISKAQEWKVFMQKRALNYTRYYAMKSMQYGTMFAANVLLVGLPIMVAFEMEQISLSSQLARSMAEQQQQRTAQSGNPVNMPNLDGQPTQPALPFLPVGHVPPPGNV